MLMFPFALVGTLASLIQGLLGFGGALVAVPLALLFLSKKTVVSSLEPSQGFPTFARVR